MLLKYYVVFMLKIKFCVAIAQQQYQLCIKTAGRFKLCFKFVF